MILYIDIGLHHGKELRRFIKMCERNKWKYEAHGIEASKQFCLYNEDLNATIHHKAICAQDGPVKLYQDLSEGQGNSIYSSKINVGQEYEMVQGVKLSTFLKGIEFQDINILRYNIEGAEWDMMHDLIETGLYKEFDLFLGEPFAEDIEKVGLDKKVYLDLLANHGIEVLPWCMERPGYIDLEQILKG